MGRGALHQAQEEGVARRAGAAALAPVVRRQAGLREAGTLRRPGIGLVFAPMIKSFLIAGAAALVLVVRGRAVPSWALRISRHLFVEPTFFDWIKTGESGTIDC